MVAPLSVAAYLRSAYPSDRDNGAVWSGRGVSGRIAGGVAGRIGMVRYGIYPEVTWSQNADFPVADTTVDRFSPLANPWDSVRIDWPQQLGAGGHARIGPGQSYIEIDVLSQVAAGISTENIVWGPGTRYPLTLGATAPGFPHGYASLNVPGGPLGAFVVRFLAGRLTASDYFRTDTTLERTLLSSLRLEWAPGGNSGPRLVATSIVTQPWTGVPTLAQLAKLVPRSTAQDEGDKVVDGIGALSALLPIAFVGATVFGTWGRGDFFKDAEDLVTEPDHNQFWSLGFTKVWVEGDAEAPWMSHLEYVSTAGNPSQYGERGQSSSVYRHARRPGYTNQGQLLGASIGPGSRAGYLSIQRSDSTHTLGGFVERIDWDVDTFNRSIRLKYGPDAQDREYTLGGIARGPLKLSGVETLHFDAMGGVSFRKNRQYVRFTGNMTGYKEWETNVWLDFRLVWTPGAKDRN